jgi:hypothetical protein
VRTAVGAFEGGNYEAQGYYRPQMTCMMFDRDSDFCQVCKDAIEDIIDLYSKPSKRVKAIMRATTRCVIALNAEHMRIPWWRVPNGFRHGMVLYLTLPGRRARSAVAHRRRFIFIQHGSAKLFGVPALEGMGQVEPDVDLTAWPACSNSLAGLLLLLGWFTRPVAFVLSGEMAFAYFMAMPRKASCRSPTTASWRCSGASCSCTSRLPARAPSRSTPCAGVQTEEQPWPRACR